MSLLRTGCSHGMTVHKKIQSWQGAALRVGGSILALILLFHFLPLSEVWQALRELPARVWTLALAGYLAAHLVGISKWRLMVNVGGAGLNFRQAVRCYFSGLFSTLFLPSIVGGDVVRASLALRFGKSKAGVLLGSFLDRILDFVALGLLAAVGVALAPEALAPQTRRVFLVAGIGIAVLLAIFAPVVFWFPARRFSFGIRRRLARLRRAARSIHNEKRYVLAALCLGLVIQAGFIWLMAQVANSGGLRLPFRVWLFAWPLAKLSAVIPVTQGGIGVREAALAALLIPFGARATMTVAVGLAWETIIIAGGLIAGLIAFLLGGLSVAKMGPAAASETRRDASPHSQP
ncbi:MAG TPA: lysylphosphatidylglycerol synthase transmembrane domain-containing protein [Candidatus Acidoferrales bacterium]|nr:lysylphosphatidylglycerol synthase transmembrane domain-containing protein [Candidatus Acidoferrales bacterium]